VEIIAPCPTIYLRRNRMGDGLEAMRYYKRSSKVIQGANTRMVGLDLQGPIIVGKFVDRDRPTLLESMNDEFTSKLGAKYQPYPTGVKR
jgi:2-oxoglutarate ferredoxin oxidoreductase subunit beta